jgi:predicted metal-binding membrane protein
MTGDRLVRIAPAAALAAVAGACWVITVERMQGMDMGPGTDLGGLGWFAVVWLTMMAAMMLPSLVPMATAHDARSRAAGARFPGAGTVAFAGGYLLTWLAAGLGAYALVEGARSLDLSWLAWNEAGPYIAGGVILAAALYELTLVKSAFLLHCRDTDLLRRRWRPGVRGALLTGCEHGGFCVGASGALMAALFALGVMNVAWMIVVAAVVAMEKLLPWSWVAVGTTMVLAIVLGLAVAFDPGQVPALTIPG